MGTSDGRVKIIGREGVEASIASFSQSGTQHIEFLHNRGVILRLNQVRSLRHQPLFCKLRVSSRACCARGLSAAARSGALRTFDEDCRRLCGGVN